MNVSEACAEAGAEAGLAEASPAWGQIGRALDGRQPAWLERFLAAVGRAAHRHAMISAGDRILVGVSGGKDSLCCALALALRRRRVKSGYAVAAAMVDWTDAPTAREDLDRLHRFFGLLSIPFTVIPGNRSTPPSEGGGLAANAPVFSCYSCARERKRLLFAHAAASGCSKIAFGHHLDDFLGTALMNICFQGRLEPMQPVRSFFDGSITVIRPLCEVRESAIRSVASRLSLPVVLSSCPHRGTNARDRLKPVVAELVKMDKLVREKAYGAWFGNP